MFWWSSQPQATVSPLWKSQKHVEYLSAKKAHTRHKQTTCCMCDVIWYVMLVWFAVMWAWIQKDNSWKVLNFWVIRDGFQGCICLRYPKITHHMSWIKACWNHPFETLLLLLITLCSPPGCDKMGCILLSVEHEVNWVETYHQIDPPSWLFQMPRLRLREHFLQALGIKASLLTIFRHT